MTLADLLQPEYVQLHPVATSRDAAIREIAALLENDVKVLDWEELHRRVAASAHCVTEPHASFCMCLPHARTAAVTEMVMSVGRFDPGLRIANVEQPVRYLFCIAVPPELATDYLRIIGLLARIVKDPQSEAQIHTAATPEEFIETLARLEAKL
jgi:mannitol/fructose-specific phosphotransferase system IIA component (Ntr-type)